MATLPLTSSGGVVCGEAAGEYEAPSFDDGGVSSTAPRTAPDRCGWRSYSTLASGMQVLDVDTERLRAEVKGEPSRSGEIYPHIYGKIELTRGPCPDLT